MALWPTAPSWPGTSMPGFTMSSDRLDLWLIRSPSGGGRRALDLSELDDVERARAGAFRRRADGLLYVAAHAGLRRLLSRYTGQDPQSLRFIREPCPGCAEPHGRPAVADPPVPLHFSLSHSFGVALVGFAPVPVGVDVERLPRAHTVEICAPALHPGERAELAAVPPADRRAVFGWLWTRKEAYLKGLGVGLRRGATQDYLGFRGSEHPVDWTVRSIPCFPDYAAAVAVRHPAPSAAGVRCVPARWLDSSGAWRLEDAPAGVRMPLAAAGRALSSDLPWRTHVPDNSEPAPPH